jgi:hypothetical protein
MSRPIQHKVQFTDPSPGRAAVSRSKPELKPPTTPKTNIAAGSKVIEPDVDSQAPVVDPQADQINRSFVSENKNHTVTTQRLRFSDTVIDPAVQRAEIGSEVRAIAKAFNPPALGVPTLSCRVDADGNETYVVLDGQQRRAAALLVGYDEPVTFTVHRGLLPKEEAQLFRQLNFRRSVSASVLFRTSLIEENPTSMAIQRICDDLNIEIGVPHGFSAVDLGRRLAEKQGGLRHLRWAFEMIQEVYDPQQEGGVYDGRLVEAFWLLHRHYEGQVKEDRLRKKLKQAGSVDDLVGRAQSVKSYRGGRLALNLLDAIVRAYNHHMGARGVNALPEMPRRNAKDLAPVEE